MIVILPGIISQFLRVWWTYSDNHFHVQRCLTYGILSFVRLVQSSSFSRVVYDTYLVKTPFPGPVRLVPLLASFLK